MQGIPENIFHQSMINNTCDLAFASVFQVFQVFVKHLKV